VTELLFWRAIVVASLVLYVVAISIVVFGGRHGDGTRS
jgi:hypothetical protein